MTSIRSKIPALALSVGSTSAISAAYTAARVDVIVALIGVGACGEVPVKSTVKPSSRLSIATAMS